MIKIIASVILLAIIAYLLHCYLKANRVFEKKRKEFVDYLIKENDLESLKAIGEINPFGVFERWNVSLRKVETYFSEKEEFLSNEKVLSFLNDIYDFKTSCVRYLIPAFISLSILINILICITK